MFQFQGIWLPDGERHFPSWMKSNGELVDGRGTYQIKKLRAALEHCKRLRVAVDVGAHVGFWSIQLAKRFETVHAFEPVAQFRECFERNLDGVDNVALLPIALGSESRDDVAMAINPADSGGTHVSSDSGTLSMRTLDSLELRDVDFIKVDCEGYELEVLKGARETIERCKPTLIVEQKPHKLGPNFGIEGTPAVDFLTAMGAVVRREMGGDYIISF